MKKVIFPAIIILLFLFVMPRISNASFFGLGDSQPFGGQVTGIPFQCNDGYLVYMNPAAGPSNLFFSYGVQKYSHYVFPPTPSTWILGMAGYTPHICILGTCPACTTFGEGFDVNFYGSSLL